MRVILLCAGYATRLYPLTKDKPKPLLPVAGQTMLEWILERLEPLKKEIKGIYAVTNHRFAKHFSDWATNFKTSLEIKIIDDQTTSNENRLGAIGDLAYVIRKEKIAGEDLLILAGDNLFDFDMKKFLSFCEQRRPHPVLAIYDVKDKELAKKYGLLRCDQSSRVEEFYEKPENPVTTLASCGIYWLPGEAGLLLDRYLEAGHNPDQPGHFMRWLAEEHVLYAVSLEGQWLDIGDIDSYQKADELFRGLKSKSKALKKV